jgi:hypothetical protein
MPHQGRSGQQGGAFLNDSHLNNAHLPDSKSLFDIIPIRASLPRGGVSAGRRVDSPWFYENRELVHIGEVGVGFDDRKLASIYAQLSPLVQSDCPFRKKPKTKAPATWVRPELVREVRFTACDRSHVGIR